MEIYLVEINLQCTELYHYEFLMDTDELKEINKYIENYNDNNRNDWRFSLMDCQQLNDLGRHLWSYNSSVPDKWSNRYIYFYDMKHKNNIAWLREYRINSILE